jgi:hypothetical protein
MAKKKVYRFFRPLSGQKTKNRGPWIIPLPSALTTALSRRSGRSSALPYPPIEFWDSIMIAFGCAGRFFVVKMDGFSM